MHILHIFLMFALTNQILVVKTEILDKKYRGLSKGEFEEMEECAKKLKADLSSGLYGSQTAASEIESSLFGDEAWTPTQCHIKKVEMMVELEEVKAKRDEKREQREERENERKKWWMKQFRKNARRKRKRKQNNNNRPKRKAVDYLNNERATQKWETSIRFIIVSDHFSNSDEEIIRKALGIWENGTCIRFVEVRENETENDKHLEIANYDGGCYSYIGKSSPYSAQPINLGPGCRDLGTILHEIGHALGLYHEHQRTDRDDYIDVNFDRINEKTVGEFMEEAHSNTYGVDYDMGSIMSYNKLTYATNGYSSILPMDREYNFTFGQNVEVSFMDFTLVNRMYGCECQNTSLYCGNNGYPDPGKDSECTSCMCPSGLEGDCTRPANGSIGCNPASGTIITVTNQTQCIQSPNYGDGPYTNGDSCSWLLQAGIGENITMYFDGPFGVYYKPISQTCYHWVEIKLNGNITLTGPRYCGSSGKDLLNSRESITSHGNQTLVTFNSNYPLPDGIPNYRIAGFNLCFKIATDEPQLEEEEGGRTICYECYGTHAQCAMNYDKLVECPKGKSCYSLVSRETPDYVLKMCGRNCTMPYKDFEVGGARWYCCNDMKCNKDVAVSTNT